MGGLEPEHVEVQRGRHCLIEVEEVSCIDGFVVFEDIIADFSEFVSIKVICELPRCAVGPILSVPVVRGAIDLCSSCDWSVREFFPLLVH